MQRYINPEKIDFRIPYYPDEEGGDALVSLRAVKQCIDATPTADVVEVVRCKDCKYYDRGICYHPTVKYVAHDKNHYCNYGEWNTKRHYRTQKEIHGGKMTCREEAK